MVRRPSGMYIRCVAQKTKLAEKVHKPPLLDNVINFDLKGLDASIWVHCSPSDPKSHDALIEVFKFIRNKLHFCTYIEPETLKIYYEVCEPFCQIWPSVWRLAI